MSSSAVAALSTTSAAPAAVAALSATSAAAAATSAPPVRNVDATVATDVDVVEAPAEPASPGIAAAGGARLRSLRPSSLSPRGRAASLSDDDVGVVVSGARVVVGRCGPPLAAAAPAICRGAAAAPAGEAQAAASSVGGHKRKCATSASAHEQHAGGVDGEDARASSSGRPSKVQRRGAGDDASTVAASALQLTAAAAAPATAPATAVAPESAVSWVISARNMTVEDYKSAWCVLPW